jgi:hypothetical protein
MSAARAAIKARSKSLTGTAFTQASSRSIRLIAASANSTALHSWVAARD